MASTYSSDLKLEIITTGEKAGQWGVIQAVLDGERKYWIIGRQNGSQSEKLFQSKRPATEPALVSNWMAAPSARKYAEGAPECACGLELPNDTHIKLHATKNGSGIWGFHKVKGRSVLVLHETDGDNNKIVIPRFVK